MDCLAFIHFILAITITLLHITSFASSSDTADSNDQNILRPVGTKKNRATPQSKSISVTSIDSIRSERCRTTSDCSKLPIDCLICQYNHSCVYGENITTQCRVKKGVSCQGPESFNITFKCMYCYQLPKESYTCEQNDTCRIGSRYRSQCMVKENVACLGNRLFNKLIECNYSAGVKWSTVLLLSITLGGFGVDRFYLGHWQEGIGKLFSFGGLGVWTLLDSLLIATGYLKPAGDARYS